MPIALVVDDEQIILTFIEKVLEPSGYAVLKAGPGQEALNLLNQNDNQIGFLLTDVRMPEMGGAELLRGDNVMLNMTVPAHAVSGGQNLAINDHEGPCSLTIAAAKYCLHQTFQVGAAAPKCLCPVKAPSAEFAPDPALDPLWISHKEPFHGAAKKDLGFQVIIKVAPQDVPEVNDKPGK